MPTDRYAARRKKLLRKLKADKLGGMLVTNEMNVTWLTGFRGDSTWLFIVFAYEEVWQCGSCDWT